jgi:hypothetical protein
LARAWSRYSVEYPLKDTVWRLESPALPNQELSRHCEASQSSLPRRALGASPFSPLRKVLEVSHFNLLYGLQEDSRSSHLCKAVQVNRFNSQTHISLHMGRWRLARLEFHSLPPTRLPQLAIDCRRICTVEATTKLWTMVLLTLC